MKLFMAPIAKRNYGKRVIVILWVSCFGNGMMNFNPVFGAALPTRITISVHDRSFELHPLINGAGDNGSFCFSRSFVPWNAPNCFFGNFRSGFCAVGFSLERIVCVHYSSAGIFKRLLISETPFTTAVPIFSHLAVKSFIPLIHFFFTPKAGGWDISIHSLSYDKGVKLVNLLDTKL